MIDFTMNGINICLLLGSIIVLQGICFLVMQNPLKHFRKFRVRDYIIFALIMCFVIIGITVTTIGIVNALGLLS